MKTHTNDVMAIIATLCCLEDIDVESVFNNWDRIQRITLELNRIVNCGYTAEQTLDAILLLGKKTAMLRARK